MAGSKDTPTAATETAPAETADRTPPRALDPSVDRGPEPEVGDPPPARAAAAADKQTPVAADQPVEADQADQADQPEESATAKTQDWPTNLPYLDPSIDRGPEPQVAATLETRPERPPPLEKVDEHFPGLYDRSDCRPPREVDPHRPSPEWVADRNPGWPDAAGRDANCGDCTRASESTWRGVDTQAGALTDAMATGESVSVMDAWSSGDRVPADFDTVAERLEALGPGSSALVAAYWSDGGGHWFNACNDNGVIVAVDGQRCMSERWPPTYGGLRFEEADCRKIEAVFIDPQGRHLRRDDRM